MKNTKRENKIILLKENQLTEEIKKVTSNAYKGCYDLVYVYDKATSSPILLLEGGSVVESFLDKTFNICFCNIYGIGFNDSKFPIVEHKRTSVKNFDGINKIHSIGLQVTGDFSDAYRYLKSRVTLTGICTVKVS